MTSIGEYAFYKCSSLTDIILPKSVSRIGSNAFANCPELLDVYCYAEMVPSTETNAFDGSYPEYATLHVPTNALVSYKATAPWSSFGKFETTSIAVESITLSQSTATLLDGASLTLTATVAPDNATDNSVTWSSSNPSVATVDNMGKVTAIASGTATITAEYNGMKAVCTVRCRFENADNGNQEQEDQGSQQETQGSQSNTDWKASHSDVSIVVGESFRLKVTNSAGETAKAIWTMDVDGVVAIDGRTVTGRAPGTVTLTTTVDGVTMTCIVRVK